MSQLFTPLALGPLTLANRIVVSPMCQYAVEDGNASDWHLMHLGQLAMSGAGLLVIEATAVEAEGRITPGDLGLYSDDNEAALARVLRAVRRHSRMPIAVQLGHAGRKASSHVPWDGGQSLRPDEGAWTTSAPSALPHAPGEPEPLALDAAGLQRIVSVHRGTSIQRERMDRLLLHLFQHDVHHRGQAHAMLSGTSVSPPQLDEFFSAGEAPLRAAEFAELGWTEERIWGGPDNET